MHATRSQAPRSFSLLASLLDLLSPPLADQSTTVRQPGGRSPCSPRVRADEAASPEPLWLCLSSVADDDGLHQVLESGSLLENETSRLDVPLLLALDGAFRGEITR